MASELEKSLKSVAEKIAQYIDDAATLTVETRAVEIGAESGAQFDQARARNLGRGLKPGGLLLGRFGTSEGKPGRLRQDQEGWPDGDALRGRNTLQPDLAHLRPRPGYM